MMGRDMKISWTGTLSGNEIKLKRGFAGDGVPSDGGMPGGSGAETGSRAK